MAIDILRENVSIHQTLGDEPNTDNGLSADDLKAWFDRPVEIIRDYLNDTVVPAVNKAEEDYEGAKIVAAGTRSIAESADKKATEALQAAEAAAASATNAAQIASNASSYANSANDKAQQAMATASDAKQVADTALASAEGAANKSLEALRIANDVAQEMKDYSPSGTRSIAEAAMRMADQRIIAPEQAAVGQYFRVKEIDENGKITAVEAVDAPNGGGGSSGQNVELDTTLTQSGKAADAKAVGDRLTELEQKIPEGGQIDAEQIAGAVSSWLDEHPEATTTVVDGSITPAKTDFLEIRSPIEPETVEWVSAGYNMIANDGYLDVRGVDAITVVHANATGRDVAIELYDENQSKIQAFTVVSNVANQAAHYNSENIITWVTVLDIPALVGETGAAYVKVRVQQNTSKDYKLDIYLGDINAESGFHWSEKYGSPEIPEGAVTLDKTSFMVSTGNNLIDTTRFEDSGYSGILFDQFGIQLSIFADFVDVSINKTVFIRGRTYGAVDGEFAVKIATYDADKTFLDSNNNHVKVTKMRVYSDVVTDGSAYISGANTLVYRYEFDDSVKFARFASKGTAGFVRGNEWKNVIVSYKDILDMTSPPEQYWRGISNEWRNAILDAVKKDTRTMVMIGDSLTNWGGGSDGQKGFLKIVHDKTGVLTTNQGTAGAWWQTGHADDVSAVGRVNTIIANDIKYDVYCFLMGTNAGANTDTGETSADPSTMPGAIRYCMEKLKSYDPTAQILVCLPPQRADGNDNQEKVNEVIKKIVESYSVKTLDVYHHSGIVPNTVVANANYLPDGLHLGDNGITALGNLLAAEIKYLLCL